MTMWLDRGVAELGLATTLISGAQHFLRTWPLRWCGYFKFALRVLIRTTEPDILGMYDTHGLARDCYSCRIDGVCRGEWDLAGLVVSDYLIHKMADLPQFSRSLLAVPILLELVLRQLRR